MILYVYNKAPMWWTAEEWAMTEKDRESIGIKLIEININI